jgi:regulatory protein
LSGFRTKRRPDDEPAAQPRPGRITAIQPQRRDNARVNIFIDGAFAFGLHIDLQLEHDLAPGDDLDEDKIGLILRQDQTKRAISTALNLIAYRSRAAGELKTRLRERDYPPEAIDDAIARMRELGYLDDRDFADRWVESRQTHRPRSVRMLTRELQQKGVAREVIEDTLEDADIDEFGDALALAEHKVASLSGLDEPTRDRRLSGFLARRGYSYDIIRRVMDALGSEAADEPD